ncbi:hypothetical protein AB0M41_16340 [Streptomyces sp. NPDC051896]|uniref:hypothetical protein n=1 Tax=Streptomyces sp. NPDC051896 TaxID=3155416 RepID=UPI003427582F
MRQEIIQRQATQHNVLALQLTISGAVFSFGLTGTSRTWVIQNPARFGIPGLLWIYAYFVTYPGVALLALGAAAPAAFTTDHGQRSLGVTFGLGVVWLLGLTVTALCCLLLWRTAKFTQAPDPTHRIHPPQPRSEPVD